MNLQTVSLRICDKMRYLLKVSVQRVLVLLAVFILLVSAASVSQDLQNATYSFISSRFTGMGNAAISGAEGVWATFINPAGLVRMNNVELGFQQTINRDKIKFDPKLLGISHKIWRFSWANKIAMIKDVGTFDYTYTGIGLYINQNTAVGGSFIWKRRHPTDYFQILGEYNGFLSGIQYFLNQNEKLGAIIQMDEYGKIMIFGVGYLIAYKKLRTELDLRYEKKLRYNLGSEYVLKYINLRAGLDSINGFFFGGGKNIVFGRLIYSISIDLAYSVKQNLGQWTLKFNF